MSEPLYTRNIVLEYARETRYGTDPGSGATSVVPVYGMSLPVLDSRTVPIGRSVNTREFSGIKRSFGSWKLNNVSTPIFGSGTGSSPPEWMYLLDGCGFDHASVTESGAAGMKWTYTASPPPSLTLREYVGKRKYTLNGARGSWGFSATAGQPPKASFSFAAPYKATSIESYTGTVPTQTRQVSAFCDANFEMDISGVGSVTTVLRSMEIQYNNQLMPLAMSHNDGGISEFRLGDATVTWKVTVEHMTIVNWFGGFLRDPAPYDWKLGVTFGSGAGNRIKVDTDGRYSAQLAATPTFSDSNGIMLVNLVFYVHGEGSSSPAVRVVHY